MANADTYFTEAAFQIEVRKILKEKGLRHRDVAGAMGITQPAVTTALNGRSPGLLARIYQQVTGQKVDLTRTYRIESSIKAIPTP